MKKVIILSLMLILLTSTYAFAWTGYPSSPESTTTQPYQIIYNNGATTQLITSSQEILIKSGIEFRTTHYQSLMKVYTLSDGIWNLNNSNVAIQNFTALTQSNYDVYHGGSYDYGSGQYPKTSLFFQRPLPPLEAGMEGALPNLLRSLQIILPIILGGILLVIGFRKAWAMLIRIFKTT